MKARIREGCTGCGLCEITCPEVFRIKDDGLAEVYAEVTAETLDGAKDAAESCPAAVIDVEK